MEQLSEVFPTAGSTTNSEPIELTHNELLGLQNDAELVPGQIYVANDIDWVIAGGTGKFAVVPDAADKLPSTGRYLAADFVQQSWWEGEIHWNNGQVFKLHDSDLDNHVYGDNTVRNFPFGNANVYANEFRYGGLTLSDNAQYSHNTSNHANITLSGNAVMHSNDCHGEQAQVTMSSGNVSHNGIHDATVTITGTGGISRSSILGGAQAIIDGSGTISTSTMNGGSLHITSLIVQLCVVQYSIVNAQGSSGNLYASYFTNTSGLTITNIPSITMFMTRFDAGYIQGNAAKSLFTYMSEFSSYGYLAINENAECQMFASRLSASSRIDITQGKFDLNHASACDGARITHDSAFTNTIFFSTILNYSHLTFSGQAKNNRLDYTTITNFAQVNFNGSSDGNYVFACTVTSAAKVNCNDSLKTLIIYSTVADQSGLHFNNTEDLASIYDANIASKCSFTVNNLKKGGQINHVTTSSGAQITVTDHAGYIFSCFAAAGYTLELGTDSGIHCRGVYGMGSGSATVSRTTHTLGSATNNI